MDEIKVIVIQFPDRPNLVLKYIDPMTGKQKYRSAKTNDRILASRAAGVWEDELRTGRYVAPIKLTWAAFRTRYEDEVLSSLAPKTEEKVSSVFNQVEKLISPEKLSQVTSARLSFYASKLREDGRSEQTIKGHLAHLKAALAWAVRMGLLAKLPTIQMPKRAKGQKVMKGRPITLEEFERLLGKLPEVVTFRARLPESHKPKQLTPEQEAAKAAHTAAVVASWKFYLEGLWWSGLRLSESLELFWDRDDRLCIDLSGKHPMLRIPAAHEKGNQDRLLPIVPEFARFLLAVPKAERVGRVFNPLPARSHSSAMTAHSVGQIVSELGVKAGVKVNTDQAGKVKYASAHDLRRSFGERWAGRVMPQVLMELMRHESINTTLRFYVGRNAQNTAATLWEADKQSSGYSSGYNRKNGKSQPTKETVTKRKH